MKIYARPQAGEGNNLTTIVGAVKDITERRLAHEALRESEERFRLSLKNAPVSVAAQDCDLRFLWAFNQRTVDSNFVIGKTDTDLFPPETAEQLIALKREVLQTEKEIRQQLWVNSGSKRVLLDICLTLMHNSNGQVIGVGIATVDLTQSKLAEEALSESEEKYRFLIEKMKDVIWQASPDLRFTFISHADEFLGGYKPEELLGRSIFDFMTEKSKSEVMERAGARQKLLQQGEKIGDAVYEVEHIQKDGRHIWVEVSVYPMYDVAGRLTHFQGLTRDINKRKQAEEQLKEEKEHFEILFNTNPDALQIMRLIDGLVTNVNDGFTMMSGFEREDIIGKRTLDVELWENPEDRQNVINDLTKKGYCANYEAIFKRKNGIRFIGMISARLYLYQDEPHVITVIRDVTERKQMENSLRDSEARNRAMVEAIPDLMFIQSRAGVYVDFHADNRQMLIAPPEAFLGRTTYDVLPPALTDVFQAKFDLAFQTGEVQTHEYPLDVLDGKRYFESRMIAYGDDRLLSIVRDITERKQTEQKLLAFEEFQRVLLNASKLTSILLLDGAGTIITINEFGAQLFGKRSDELLGLPIYDVFPKDNAGARALVDARKAIFDEVCRTAVVVSFEDFRQGIWFENSMYPILDATGKVSQVAIYAHNITERKQNEERLRRSEQWYRALAEAAHDMIFVIDRDDRFVYVNNTVLEQFGVQSNALVGQLRSNWFGKSDTEKSRKNIEKVFSTGEPFYSETYFAFPHGHLYLSTWLVPLKDQNGMVENVLGVSHDISELKRLERSLRETSQQLEIRVELRTIELRESRDQLRKLTQQVVFAQEEERRRISRELHDEAGQTLVGLRFSLDNVYRELPADLDSLRRRMEKALALTDQTLNRLRQLAYDLRPPMLDLIGVNLGIKELCREFSDQTGIKVEYSGVELEGLPDEVSISLYRFAQEALTNVAKHAAPRKCRLYLNTR